MQKNALHYVDNFTAPYNVGGITQAGEVWRFFNKAAATGRDRLSFSAAGTAANLDVLATRDRATPRYHLFTVNNSGSAVSLALNVAAWGIPTNNLVLVEEVSETNHGSGRLVTTVGNLATAANQGANAVWLFTLFAQPQAAEQILIAADDATVRDGTNRANNYATEPRLIIRNDPASTASRSVAFLKFQIPATNFASLANLQFAILSLHASTSASNVTAQAHLHGLDATNWSQSTLTSATAPNLKGNAPAGTTIKDSVVIGGGTSAHILGQLVATSTNAAERLIDVTEFIRSRSGSNAAFLISQDPRWDVTLPSLAPGDTQPDGLAIVSTEGGPTSATAPRLRLIFNATNTVATTNPPSTTLTNLTPSSEATVRGGASAALDVDEAAVGYLMVKYNASPFDTARKTCFQFDLAAASFDTNASATFTVNFTDNFKQRVQLWSLDQPYPSFTAAATWNSAQANDTNSNNLRTTGPFTATPLGPSVILPTNGTAPHIFNLPRLGDVLHSGRVTLALSAVTDAANNTGGLRLQRTNAILALTPFPASRPLLQIALPPGQIHLTWPAWAAAFAPASATSLAPPISWAALTNAPMLSNGVWLLPLGIATNGSRFFRLQSP